MLNKYQIFLRIVDGHVKTDIFMLSTFLARGIFSIHQIQKKVKKRPESKKILYQKISYVMSINHAKEFLKSILYFKTFLPERHMAASIPILKKKNLKFEIYIIYDIYFQKITVRL